MDSEFIAAINATADTSFDPANPINFITGQPITDPIVRSLISKPTFAARRSGSSVEGFYRPGERDKDGSPFEILPTQCPPYIPQLARVPTNEEKRGAWHLQDEYLAGRLGRNEEENGRLWNTVKWIDRHYRIATMPAEATPPFNIHIADAILQDTGASTGSDDESPDQRQDNEGIGFERIKIGEADGAGRTKVIDEDGVTRLLEIGTDDFTLLQLADQLDECDELAEIDVNKSARDLLPERFDFPVDADDRAESGKIIRILMAGMRTLWTPVIRAIADRVTMSSLGRSQGVGDDKAATVGRWRSIEGLRLAESIRRGLERQTLAPTAPARRKRTNVQSVNEMPSVAAPMPVRAPSGHYLNQARGPVIMLKPLAANDNQRFDATASKAA
jgi:hypothetical protein